MSDFNGKPFKEAMCIEAMRVFDSCSSQDCLEDLAFTFSEADQTVINAAAYIKKHLYRRDRRKLCNISGGIQPRLLRS